jgi:hypothetical protein
LFNGNFSIRKIVDYIEIIYHGIIETTSTHSLEFVIVESFPFSGVVLFHFVLLKKVELLLVV